MLSFKPVFSLSSFTFIKRLFSSSLLYSIRVVSSAFLRLLLFLWAMLIPACASSRQRSSQDIQEFLKQRSCSQNIKRLLLIKGKQISQLMNLVLFYVWEDTRVLSSWKHFFDIHLNYLRPVSFSFLSCVPLRMHHWRWLQWPMAWCHNILCLLIGQMIFFIYLSIYLSICHIYFISPMKVYNSMGKHFLLISSWSQVAWTCCSLK